ncbi:MAG: YjbQ family protein [Candidatus Omnitrophica bacterium]|nr:YjbQ family protein [Candidatus Omnitrophota bacterium]
MKKETITLQTSSRTDFLPITKKVQAALSKMNAGDGVCTLYVPHTTAGIFVNEGYDPDVMRDVEYALEKAVPWRAGYAHSEGNAAAHIKAILTGNSQQVLVEKGKILLGRWEEIFFAEFDGPRSRSLIITCSESSS